MEHYGQFVPNEVLMRAIQYETILGLYQVVHKLRMAVVGRFIIHSNQKNAYCMIEVPGASKRGGA